jgi:prolyl oligopeptidase
MTDDPYRWLEELDAPAAQEWVRARNAEAFEALTGSERFAALRDGAREVLDAADRIPYPTWRGDHLYNLWKDDAHPRGLWRRTTVDSYRSATPEWEELLDVDALAAAEGENWVWQGAIGLRPDYDRYLVMLSRGGADAHVIREFDRATGQFVEDGFTLPEAKSRVGWIDQDQIYVGTDFGPGSLTASGYPRLAKQWRRGQPLTAATLVFEVKPDDMSAFAAHDDEPGFEHALIGRRIDFYRQETFLLRPGRELVRIDVPEDADIGTHGRWLVIRPRSDWSVGAATYPAGSILVTPWSSYVDGDRALTAVFTPDAHTAYNYHTWTHGYLIVSALSDVHSRLTVWAFTDGGGWSSAPLLGLPEFGQSDVVAENQDTTDEVMASSTGFLEPTSLWYADLTAAPVPVRLRSEPAFFDPAGLTVRQFFAGSADGTRVPYFVVGDESTVDGPALLGGYGGFEVSRTPNYSGTLGRSWLTRGGTYVVANIRGGGEYGPAWHRAALRENRPRAYEDFAAVARDLVDRGITTPARLGIQGGSNGGLLMGAMLTGYPELFGAVVAQVPLMDMRRYHRLLAGASWVAEYGDPDDEADWAFLRTYSPYHNVRSGQTYPPVLMLTSTRDDRVHPGHARKMTALLQSFGYDVTYYENVEGGHGGAADNAQVAFQHALVMEFLWRRLAPDAYNTGPTHSASQ